MVYVWLVSRAGDKWALPWHLNIINLWCYTGIQKIQEKNILRVLLYFKDKESLSELKDVYNIMNPTGEKKKTNSWYFVLF